MTQPRSLTLTLNELLAVLQVMGVSTMNGLAPDILERYTEAERAERLNSGVETLLNRGLFELSGSTEGGDQQLVLDDALVALVGAAVIPDATLLLSEVQPDGSAVPRYFSATPYIKVEHGSPRPGIYTFTHIPDADALRLRVQTLLAHLLPGVSGAQGFERRVPDAVLTEVMQHSRGTDAGRALRLLQAQGWPQGSARDFVEDAGTARVWTGMVASGLRGAEPAPSDSAIALKGQRGCWLITQVAGQTATLLVRRSSGRECEAAFLALVEPLVHVAAGG